MPPAHSKNKEMNEGITKMHLLWDQNLKLRNEAKELMSTKLLNFVKTAALKLAENEPVPKNMFPSHILQCFSEYFESDVINRAASEGAKAVLLYQNNCIEFIPEQQRNLEQAEPILRSCISAYIYDTSFSDAKVDDEESKKVVEILLHVVMYLAEKARNICRENENESMTDEQLGSVVDELFPPLLRMHVKFLIANYLERYKSGLLKYDPAQSCDPRKRGKVRKKSMSQSKSLKRKKSSSRKTSLKSSKSRSSSGGLKPKPYQSKTPSSKPFKGKPSSKKSQKPRSSSPKKKRKSSGKRKTSAQRRKAPENENLKMQEEPPILRVIDSKDLEEKPPMLIVDDQESTPEAAEKSKSPKTKSLNFPSLVKGLSKAAMVKTPLDFEKGSSEVVGDILQDSINSLIKTVLAKVSDRTEIDLKDVREAVGDVFPKDMSRHAIAIGIAYFLTPKK